MIVNNKSSSIQYLNIKTGCFLNDDFNLSKELFTDESVVSHIYNVNNFVCDLNDYKFIIDSVVPIPPRSKYLFENGKFKKLNNGYVFKKPSYDLIVRFAKRLLKLVDKKIAVELSGGLDTSIIIGLLKDIGLYPVLIGSEYDFYEFRTERHIQRLISSSFDDVILYKPKRRQFSELLKTPVHFLPDFSSLYYSMCVESIDYISSKEVGYILHGTGFDALLTEPITNPSDDINWPFLTESWLNDNIYQNYGLRYFDPSSINTFKRIIIALRSGSGQDIKKLWARKFFSSIIPPELSHYQYKANFGSVWLSSLDSAKHDIDYLVRFAYDLTGITEFKNFSFDRLFDTTNQKVQLKPLAVLSYANWIHSLYMNNRITS